MPTINIKIAGKKWIKTVVNAANVISVIQCHGIGLSGFKAVMIVNPAITNPQLIKITLPRPMFWIHILTFSMLYNLKKMLRKPNVPPKTVKKRINFRYTTLLPVLLFFSMLLLLIIFTVFSLFSNHVFFFKFWKNWEYLKKKVRIFIILLKNIDYIFIKELRSPECYLKVWNFEKSLKIWERIKWLAKIESKCLNNL